MKNAFVAIALLVASLSVKADQIINPEIFNRTAELVHFNIDPKSHLSGAVDGTIEVNAVTKKVVLTLSNCPKNAMCIHMGSLAVIELPLIKISKDTCGATVYTARRDKRRVDGFMEVLKVVDYTTMVCEIGIAKDRMTHVEYGTEILSRMERKIVRTNSKFDGFALHGLK